MHCCAAAEAPAVVAGSRRRRLWDLPAESHCPLIGVCLPLAVLRKITAKTIGAPALGDYELHSCVVNECGRRTRLTEALQRELDARCALVLRRYAAARSSEALAALWQQALDDGDIAQPLWAALTHARCDTALTVRICRDVHMLQHQAGATARADVQELRARAQRADVLERELADERRRHVALQAQRGADIETLGAQLLRARAEAIAKDSLVASLRDDLAAVREQARELDSRAALQQRIDALAERQRELLRDNAALREALRDQAALRSAVLPDATPPTAAGDPSPAAVSLEARVVLCVGGRHGDVPQYREWVERAGGRFLHHDGGVEHNTRQLDSSLAAADLVICQAGCISHNAYWLVKDHCKRTGKRCVYLERPSVAGLERGLAQVAA
jgi:hypothetical protein